MTALPAITVLLVVPTGYRTGEEFADDCGFQIAEQETRQPVAWQAMNDDLNQQHVLTTSKGVADIWRKSGLTVRELFA